MDVLVVGGAGYIGSHICKLFANDGHNPITLDDFSTGHRSFVKWGPLVECNILNSEELIRKLSSVKFEGVIHLAARIEVSDSLKDPTAFYQNNIGGTIGLIHALSRIGRNVPIVFTSTAAVYGHVDQDLIGETSPMNPINPYGSSKKISEDLLNEYSKMKNIPLCILRCFNVAGADPELEVGEAHNPETHLIPKLLEAALDSNINFNLFGHDYSTHDGTCVRDFVHVVDLAKAHVNALYLLLRSPERYCLNIGYSRGYSVKEVLAAVERVTGKKIRIQVKERKIGDPSKLVADGSEGVKTLPWEPLYADQLETIILHAYEWKKKMGFTS